MAEIKSKKTTDNNAEEMVTIRLRRDPNPKAPQQEFFSYNFTNYLIQRGVETKVPRGLYEIILNGEKAEDAALVYAEEKALREPSRTEV